MRRFFASMLGLGSAIGSAIGFAAVSCADASPVSEAADGGLTDPRTGEDGAAVDAAREDARRGQPPGAPSSVTALAAEVASTVTTLAGSGTEAFADGTGVGASFRFPSGVAVDPAGNVIVTDRNNHRIRKVTPAGVVTTLAGSGLGTFADGTGVGASFNYPWGLATDSAGNVYVADKYNQRIRKVTAAGVVTTLAGSGTPASVDGTGTAASFSGPTGVAVDTAGNVYVTESGVEGVDSNRVRRVTAAGVVTTLAGSDAPGAAEGAGVAARFAGPVGIAVDAAGILYVADEHNHRIRRVTADGVVTTLAGSGTAGRVDGTGAAAAFNTPVGIGLDSAGNVFVGGYYDGHIRRVTTAGVVTTLAGADPGGFADGPGPVALFNYPYGVAVDAARTVFVADYYGHRIRKVTTIGIGELTVTWSAPSAATAIAGYAASATAAGRDAQSCTTTGATTCTIRGLTSGVAYEISITATNAAGTSVPSASTIGTPN